MRAKDLRQLQAPLKSEYTANPASAVAELRAAGEIDLACVACRVDAPMAGAEQTVSGLHPKAGGDGTLACSGDMLLQSLVACSGVTFAAVATAMGLEVRHAKVEAVGEMDFRGTLGVDRDVPIGLTSIALTFSIDSPEPDDKIDKLIQLTERYCVVLQTLANGVAVTSARIPAV